MGFHRILEWWGVAPDGKQRKVLWKGRRNKGIGLGTENLTCPWGPWGLDLERYGGISLSCVLVLRQRRLIPR